MTQREPAFDTSAALSAISDSEAITRRSTAPNPPILYLLWGTVYALGYLALHAALFRWAPVSLPLALTLFAGLTVAGAAVSTVLGIRAGKELRGASSRRGMLYGLAWATGMVSVGFIVVALLRLNLEPATLVWLASAVATLLVGVLFTAGGAVFLDLAMFLQGVAVLAANLISVLVGTSPLVLIGWLAACAVLFAGAGIEAHRSVTGARR
ncbi:hypothetical protein NQ152_07535 [Microbacterium sp. zg.B48]|uniref:hypothetical protein n=1 Tax=Microbacterium sp. zg.B48 TaxID=2969408 RepID=UPI00214C4D9F|nr:hypothetical protein [Microbacterium sp. zg.B48]MCR2763360.1 hypothetical protein [Microbacterium sp. zg.B48]